MSKDEILNRHNGSPLATAAMGGEAMVTDATSAPASEAPRLAAQIAPVDPLTRLQNVVHDLDVARFTARNCRAAVTASREAFNVALAAWNFSGPAPMTQEALRQEWIDSNQAERRRKAEARQLQRPMTVGETAKAMSGGNRRPGGGASYKRGAVSRAEARTIEANKMVAARMAANVAASRGKLPSDR